MPVIIDRRAVRAEARALMQSGRVSPVRVTLLFLAIDLVLSEISAAAAWLLGDRVSFSSEKLPVLFTSILVSLLGTVLLAGYSRYCLGIERGEEMPCSSLFSAFPFAGRVILLTVLEGLLIALGLMLFIVPGVVLSFAYAFALFHLCETPEIGALEALRRSRMELRGFKGQLFLLLLGFVPLLLLFALPLSLCEYFLNGILPNTLGGTLLYALLTGVLTGIAALYLTPYIALSQVVFYRRVTALGQEPEYPEGSEE